MIIGVPIVVQPIVVAVEPVAVPVGVRHIPIAVGVAKLRQKSSVAPPPRSLKLIAGLNIIRHLECSGFWHRLVSYFLR